MANIFTDTAEVVTMREYLTANMPYLEVPFDFLHTPPGSKPVEPAYPGAMTAGELAEVDAWRDGLVAPTLAAAITYKTDYETYNAEMDAWKFSNQSARSTQYRIAYGDALIYNKPTTAISSDTSGTGSSPPPPAVAPRNDP